ncbi:MAG: nuclear transport factor 2 family protein [Proteobacteria bacterium]|nr:nuclear transport factor 2 family protein [Pseudomonadota bacterium]
MTIRRRHLAVTALLTSAATALATTGAAAQDKDKEKANKETAAAVADAVIELTKAMLAADKGKLESLVADQLSYGHSSGLVQDKAAFVDVIVSKKTVYKSIELSKQTIAISGNDAIVRHAWMSESGGGDGNWTVSKLGVLQVWQKQGSNWKLLARQAFKA